MDEDDDFFDMRQRIRLPLKRKKIEEKKKKEKKKDRNDDDDDDDSGSNSSSSSDDSDIQEYVPKKRIIPAKPVTAKRRTYLHIDSDEEDSEDSEDESIESEPSRPRRKVLTPPPQLRQEEFQRAMALLQDKPLTRRGTQAADSTLDEPASKSKDLLNYEDDFDVSKYQAKMNSEIAKVASQYHREVEKPAEKILLLMYGHKKEGDGVPADWEKPVGMRALSTVTFLKMREEFLKSKNWQGNIVLACKGVKIIHGTPKSLGLTNESRIDVYTENGWQLYQKQKEMAAQRGESVISSSDDEPEPPKVRTIALILQTRGDKPVKVRLSESVTIEKLVQTYRKSRSIPSDKKITILLDGDALDESETVKDLDLEDDVLLDVEIS